MECLVSFPPAVATDFGFLILHCFANGCDFIDFLFCFCLIFFLTQPEGERKKERKKERMKGVVGWSDRT